MKAILISALVFITLTSSGYGLLTHEAIIDATWEKSIVPLLQEKYPGLSEEQLKEAHAYVYGGAIVSDIGYYPLGSIFFTHLTHYVRTGDFVHALLAEARDVNEFAFAIGVLCHYMADKYGHPMGTNRAVPLLFPKLKEKYGDTVTYEQHPIAHIRTEFGFDVLQTARGNYRSQDYHNFIGFKISKPVLERAFLKTYGLELDQVFPSFGLAQETFRFAVRSLFPQLTKDAWKARHNEIAKLNPLATKETYRFHMKHKEYKKEFGKPKIFSPITFLLMTVLPKVGPLARFKYKAPSEEAEKYFNQSFQTITARYTDALQRLNAHTPSFDNDDLDTGHKIVADEYQIADKTYCKLLKKLCKNQFTHLNAALKKNIMNFYNRPQAEKAYDHHEWKKIDKQLTELEGTVVTS